MTTTVNIFEQAARDKLRFETKMGQLSVEDLWDLPLTHASKANLDDIAKGLYKQLKEDPNVSFVHKLQSSAVSKVQLCFDLVKHIIDVRLAEKEAAELARSNNEKKQRILAIIEGKEAEALSAKSVEDLRAMLASL